MPGTAQKSRSSILPQISFCCICQWLYKAPLNFICTEGCGGRPICSISRTIDDQATAASLPIELTRQDAIFSRISLLSAVKFGLLAPSAKFRSMPAERGIKIQIKTLVPVRDDWPTLRVFSRFNHHKTCLSWSELSILSISAEGSRTVALIGQCRTFAKRMALTKPTQAVC